MEKTKIKKYAVLLSLIIAFILLGLIIFSRLDTTPHGRFTTDVRRVSDFKQFEISLDFYYKENNRYPVAEQGCQDTSPLEILPPLGFIATIPHDRKESEGHPPYQYAVSADGNQYVVKATLENPYEALDQDLDGDVLGCDCDDPNYCVGSDNLEI